MSTTAENALFTLIKNNFERSSITGTVQITSEKPSQKFFITVGESTISCSEGALPTPTATIVMRDNVIAELVERSYAFDNRVVDFSSRLSLGGNERLADFVLHLVRTPSAGFLRKLDAFRETWRERSFKKVERVHRPSRDILCGAMEDSQPLLITGVLDAWDVPSWNPKSLEFRFGKYRAVSYLPWAIKDYTDSCAPRYTGGVGLPGPMWKHFPPPAALQGAANLGFPQLWLGSAESREKSVTTLHCDYIHGFLCQVFGRKKVFLYSPDQERLVYPYRAFHNMGRACWTGPDVIDYEKYPLFRDARPVELILNPGEVLFIPFGWFHCIFSLDLVMSVSYPVEDDDPF